jgi:hypothetical protein
MNADKTEMDGVNWRGAVWITVAAVALYVGFRVLPTGTNLHHLDFQVSGAGALEMCDPSNPQFIPVVAARSPVRLELRAADGAAAEVGRESAFVLTLTTSAGKPIGPVDLATVHTRKLHLLVIDPTLTDYQHLHPEPGGKPGEWVFRHTPARAGVYRVFADFTPTATGRGLYSFADYTVGAGAADSSDTPGTGVATMKTRLGGEAETGPWRFRLATQDGAPVRAGKQATLIFTGREISGGEVPMAIVMDAYAHLVGFDMERSGFAHLHPRGERPGDYAVSAPDAREPKLWFDLTIPKAGDYVVWAQVNLEGGERFLPFVMNVAP